jgi:hypothetical protein
LKTHGLTPCDQSAPRPRPLVESKSAKSANLGLLERSAQRSGNAEVPRAGVALRMWGDVIVKGAMKNAQRHLDNFLSRYGG